MSERVLESPPNLLALYGKAALGSIPGASLIPFLGIGGGASQTPDTELVIREARVEPDRLADYCRVCGFTLRDVLPPTYPHMLAFPMQMALITEEGFPFGAVGLVHISNEITQHWPLEISDPLEIRVRVSDLRPHAKGQQFDFISEVRSGGELVWESTSTTLKRGKPSESAAERDDELGSIDFAALQPSAEWKLPADLGRRYGSVSGDRNPIHMSEWTAKPLGFPKAIAHGMWTKARALAALESQLPDSMSVSVRFKRPILLPGRVSFASGASVASAGAGTEPIPFAVRDARSGDPHLDGLLKPL